MRRTPAQSAKHVVHSPTFRSWSRFKESAPLSGAAGGRNGVSIVCSAGYALAPSRWSIAIAPACAVCERGSAALAGYQPLARA